MKKVLIGMSGGVDSSTAALLLKKDGYEVFGATMVLIDSENTIKSVNDAKRVCDIIGIKHYVIDLKKQFRSYVINNFINTYKSGGTPNPCVVCNKYIKFGYLWDYALELGCDYIATGHYAKIREGKIIKSSSKNKDQSYFLYGINRDIINHIIFPLEGYDNKDEVRKLAHDNGIFVYDKKESQDICFIPDGKYAMFLDSNLDILPDKGDFVLKDGTIIGKHKGIIYYTIGQRKGLGISYNKPLYVISINYQDNTVVLGDEIDLYDDSLVVGNVNVLVDELPNVVMAKIRFRSKGAEARLEWIDNDSIKVTFKDKQRAITRGQSVVFYDGDVLLGGGIIK